MPTNAKDVEDQVAIITGGASGIGRATVRLFTQHGARVAFFDVLEQRSQELAQELRTSGAEISFHRCDVTRGADVQRAVEAVLDQYGRIDILVNVVGGSKLTWLWEMTEADWDTILTFNLKSTFLCCRAVVPHMMARKSGVVVNISSGQGATPAPQRSSYSAAKAGVIGFTRTIAAELAPYQVRANVVAPSATNTERARSFFAEEGWAEHLARQPFGRIAEPEDIAEAILFMASPRSRHITGQTLYVNGGTFMP